MPATSSRIRKIVLAVFAVIILAGINIYLSRNARLYILNPFQSDATVSISGADPITIAAGRRLKISISEGKHAVTIKLGDRPAEEVQIVINSSLAARFSSTAPFFLNIGGGAIVTWEESLYSEKPSRYDNPAPYQIYVGEPLISLTDIQYVFERFPDEITIDEGSKVKRHRVKWIRGTPDDLLAWLVEDELPREKLLHFAEAHLLDVPSNENLLQSYMDLPETLQEVKQCANFLRKGLARRPVAIEWHQTYQRARMILGEKPAIVREYEKLLVESPQENSALVYLRGRIEPNISKQIGFMDRAIAADAKNAYPYHAKAYALITRCDFAAARQLAVTATELKPDSYVMDSLLTDIRFALGEFEDLEKTAAKTMAAYPLSFDAIHWLVLLRGALGDSAAMHEAVDTFTAAHKKERTKDVDFGIAYLQMQVAYLENDLDRYQELVATITIPAARQAMLFNVHIERGDVDKAEELLAKNATPTADACLLLWLALRESGHTDRAKPWLAKAQELLQAGSTEQKQAAPLLKQPGDDIVSRLDDIALVPYDKRVLTVTLAALCPAQRAELLAQASKQNHHPAFPHRFLTRMINAMP